MIAVPKCCAIFMATAVLPTAVGPAITISVLGEVGMPQKIKNPVHFLQNYGQDFLQ